MIFSAQNGLSESEAEMLGVIGQVTDVSLKTVRTLCVEEGNFLIMAFVVKLLKEKLERILDLKIFYQMKLE